MDIILIFIISINYIVSASFTKTLNKNLKNHDYKCLYGSEIKKLECSHFDAMEKLNNYFQKNFQFSQISSLHINPSKPIKFDSSLNLNGFKFQSDKFEFILSNINGIEITFNPFSNQKSKLNYLYLLNSSFNLYYRNNTFDWLCDLTLLDNQLNPIFSSFKYISLGFIKPVKFKNAVCPTIFKNSQIEWLQVSNITPKNKLEFIQLNMTNSQSSLNSKIKNLRIQLSNIDILDKSLLDINVFKYLERLSIELSNLTRIEGHLFKSFYYLKQINIKIFNFKEFINGDSSWMKYINFNSSNFTGEYEPNKSFLIELNDESHDYTFPDSDFCNFCQLRIENNIFTLINTKLDLNCSCTILFLIQNWRNSINKNLLTYSVRKCFKYEDFDKKIEQCYFNSKIERCLAIKSINLQNNSQRLVNYSISVFSHKSKLILNPLFFTFYFLITVVVFQGVLT